MFKGQEAIKEQWKKALLEDGIFGQRVEFTTLSSLTSGNTIIASKDEYFVDGRYSKLLRQLSLTVITEDRVDARFS